MTRWLLCLLLAGCTSRALPPLPPLRRDKAGPAPARVRSYIAISPATPMTGPGIPTHTPDGIALVWTNTPPNWTLQRSTNLPTFYDWLWKRDGTGGGMRVEVFLVLTNLEEASNQCVFWKLIPQ